MWVSGQTLLAPKAGNTPDEYEDASYCGAAPEVGPIAGSAARFAVADGASEASFSALWAHLLVDAYGQGYDTADLLREHLADLRRVWLESVTRRPLPWYAEEKLRLGAFAALAGLTLLEPADGRGGAGTWRALAIGDSCVFQVRGDDLLASFPLGESRQFGNRPLLVSSQPERNAAVWERAASQEGGWLAGDHFLVMTDALACWFLAECERGEMPWRALLDLASADDAQRAFAEWLAGSRAGGLVKNDDTTLLWVDVADGCPDAAPGEGELPCPGR